MYISSISPAVRNYQSHTGNDRCLAFARAPDVIPVRVEARQSEINNGEFGEVRDSRRLAIVRASQLLTMYSSLSLASRVERSILVGRCTSIRRWLRRPRRRRRRHCRRRRARDRQCRNRECINRHDSLSRDAKIASSPLLLTWPVTCRKVRRVHSVEGLLVTLAHLSIASWSRPNAPERTPGRAHGVLHAAFPRRVHVTWAHNSSFEARKCFGKIC